MWKQLLSLSIAHPPGIPRRMKKRGRENSHVTQRERRLSEAKRPDHSRGGSAVYTFLHIVFRSKKGGGEKIPNVPLPGGGYLTARDEQGRLGALGRPLPLHGCSVRVARSEVLCLVGSDNET